MDIFLKFAQQYGLPFALVLFFIWRDWHREKKMTARIEVLENEIRHILTDLVGKTTLIIVANSEAMKNWLNILDKRPCIADELARKLFEETLKLSDKNTTNKVEGQ